VAPCARRIALPFALIFVQWTAVPSISVGQQRLQPCTASGPLVPLAGLSEASGLAVSQRVPGRLWTHNDAEQFLFALDSRGAIQGRVRVTGAKLEDWEAVAVGPCGSGSCLYLGDIGDNEGRRKRVTIYRVPEPQNASGSVAVADAFHATYPDGAHDAETLLIASGRLYIVTKGENGPVALYRFPADLQAGATITLERVGEVTAKVDADSRITDGSVSPDGQWIVLRSHATLTFYRASDLLRGQLRSASRVDLRSLKEPQGEGVALGPDNTIFLVGEGGGKRRPGTFARFACSQRIDPA
jgi:hypothetical protein